MWITALASALFFQFAIFQMTLFNSFSIILMKQLALTSTQFGIIASSYFYAAAIVLIPAGLLLDRYNIKRIVCVVFLMNLLALIWVCFYPSITAITTYRILCGVSNSFAFIACMKILSKLFSGKKLNLMTSLVVAFAMLGGILQSPFNLLISEVGWYDALLWAFLLGGIYWLIMLFGINVILIKNVALTADRTYAQMVTSIKNILKNSLNWQCGIYTGLLNLPVTMLAAAWGSMYLVQDKHYNSAQADSIISIIFFGMIIGSPVIGWVSTRLLTRKTTMILGAILSFLTILLIMGHWHISTIQMAILLGLLGVFTTAQILSYPIVTEANPLHDTGTAMSLVSIIIYLIGAGCGDLFGFIADKATSKLDTAFLLLPIAFLIALGISLFANEKSYTLIKSYKES